MPPLVINPELTYPLPAQCVKCRYSMDGITDPARRCPECGQSNSKPTLRRMTLSLRRTQRKWRYRTMVFFAGAWAVPFAFAWVHQFAKHYPRKYEVSVDSWIVAAPRWGNWVFLAACVCCVALTSIGAFRDIHLARRASHERTMVPWAFVGGAAALVVALGCSYLAACIATELYWAAQAKGITP